MWLDDYVKTILITGCLGDVSINIVRLLRKEGYTGSIIGADIRSEFFGSFFYNKCYILPKASDLNYLEELYQLISLSEAQLIIPNSESELAILTPSFILSLRNKNVKVLSVDPSVARVCLDKLATAKFLEDNGLSFPRTYIVGGADKIDLPCIIKQRVGQGSKGFFVVKDEDFWSYCDSYRSGDIWQELLLPDDQEYTCGIFRSNLGFMRSIVIRRTLCDGSSGFGKVVCIPEVQEYICAIADCLNLNGSINVQLRLTEKGPVAFEINPRFSSTVLFRYLFGFKDLIWSLQNLFGEDIDSYKQRRGVSKFYRGVSEYIC